MWSAFQKLLRKSLYATVMLRQVLQSCQTDVKPLNAVAKMSEEALNQSTAPSMDDEVLDEKEIAKTGAVLDLKAIPCC